MEIPAKEYSLKHITEEEKAKVTSEYLKDVKSCKKIICNPWFRGFCSFSPLQCKYAHGISNLEYIKPSNRELQHPKELLPESEIFFLKYDVRNYQILKDYIEELRVLKTLNPDEDFNLEELNSDSKKRTKIRERFHREITLEFMNFIFSQNQNNYLSMKFVEKEFELIKFPIKHNWVFNSDYYFINDIPLPPRIKNSFKAVFPFPEKVQIEKRFKEMFTNITSELQKENKGEITEKQITTAFYKNKIFDLPPLYILFKKLDKNLSDYAKQLLNQEEEKSCFISSIDQKNKFEQEIKNCIKDFWEQEIRKKFGFGKFSDLTKYLMENNFFESAKDIFQNKSICNDFLKSHLINNQMMLIFLFSEIFIINLNILKAHTNEQFLESLQVKKIKSVKCGKNHLDWRDDEINDFKINENFQFDYKNLDEKRIIVVDDLEPFIYSKLLLSKCKKIGVDIEGHLFEGGCIDLIQIGMIYKNNSRKIFIFDIHSLSHSKNISLYSEVKWFLKNLLQNNQIIKVFHDCRKDSLALHLFLDNTCPTKVYDTACLHILIEQIKMNKAALKIKADSSLKEHIYKMETLLWPGLNVVLSTYGAAHGINKLKESMKKRFNEEPREYFLKRPIDHEFLEYSARDVEDLVEVLENQEKVVVELFKEFDIGIEEIFVKDYFLEKISYYYVKEGCIPSFD